MYNLFISSFLLLLANLMFVNPLEAASGQESIKPVRAVHVVLRNLTTADAKRLVDLSASAGMNAFIVDPRDQVRFENFPGKLRPSAWSREEFMEVVRYARSQGMEVVPEIKLLTHQEQFFGSQRPTLMFNTSTYDPRNPYVYKLVFAYLDEIIDLLHPARLLIGHDEVAGHNAASRMKWLKPGEPLLPAELFLTDVERVHGYLKNKKVETWMWGDMLLSPDEFPSMMPNHLHGSALGYGKSMRDRLPKDIVVCDWHYFGRELEFPSLKTMKSAGFRVIGATWRRSETTKNFSRYAARQGADGMIATTWFAPVLKGGKVVTTWDEIARVIRESGETFKRDFPDAR